MPSAKKAPKIVSPTAKRSWRRDLPDWLVSKAMDVAMTYETSNQSDVIAGAISMVSSTALRVGELRQLRWANIDWIDNAVLLQGARIRYLPTAGLWRAIPFSSDTRNRLEKIRSVRNSASDEECIFGMHGQVASRGYYARALNKAVDRLLLQHQSSPETFPAVPYHFNWCDLRFYAARNWVRNGFSRTQVGIWLGYTVDQTIDPKFDRDVIAVLRTADRVPKALTAKCSTGSVGSEGQ